MTLYYILVFFIIGILFGSFYNVVGYRLPKEESIIYPPSHCPKCNNRLTFLELIPIFSYLFQMGKCKHCKTKISIFYPIFELTTGILFALAFYIFGFSINLLITLIFLSMSLIIIISDYFYYIIPDEVLIVSSILILILKTFDGGINMLLLSVRDGIIAFLIMFLIKKLGDFLFKKESMGGGDIKLLFVYGLTFGWPLAIISIFIASFIGLPISLILLLINKNEERIIPFGPFLSLASLIIIFFNINISFIINLFK